MAGRFNYPVPTSVGNIATNPSDTADTAANKGYVDSKVGGAQFLYQLQDVDVNETGRTQITLTGSPTPIDEVQNNILNIQPGVTFSGLAAGDFIAPTQTFPELVKILSITAGGAGSQNINVQGDATIWIGTGTFTNPQYQTIWKATPSINVGDVLTWNGTVWVNQAGGGGGQIFFDSNTFVSTGLNTSGSSASGQNFISVAGNVVSTFPNNTVIAFANTAGATKYTVTGAVFASVTNIQITPVLGSTIPNGTLIYKYTGTRTSFTDLAVDTSLTGSVTNNTLGLGVNPMFVENIVATDVGSGDVVPYATFTNTGGTVNSFNNTNGVFNVPAASQTSVIAALLALNNGILQNTDGNWFLPQAPIYVAFSANPTLAQFGIVSNIAQGSGGTQLVITINNTANFPYFNGQTYPQNLFVVLNKFNFVPQAQAEIGRLIAADSFSLRDDVTYASIDSLSNTFSGRVTADQADALLFLPSNTPANTYVTGVLLSFLGTIPASFVDGTPVVIFSRTGNFNMTVSLLDVSGGTYRVDGEINGARNTVIPSGSYPVTVCRVAPLQTIQGLTGNSVFTSTDNSVLINVSGQNINLRSAGGGGSSGQATASNLGDYVDNAINEYIQPGGQPTNLGYVQVGTVSAFTNNTRIINPTTSPATGGYTFFNGAAQANVPSVIAELGPQRQLFRAYMTGQWSLVPANYSFYRQGVGGGFVLAPVFMRSGGDWQATSSDMFPGFINTAVGLLAPVGTVTATPFRGGVSGGPRWTITVLTVSSFSAAFLGGQSGTQAVVRVNFANSATVNVYQGQEITVPIHIVGGNQVAGIEWITAAAASNSNFIDLILPVGTPVGTTFDQNFPTFTDTSIYVWNLGFPPVDTTFPGTAIVEVWLEANVWTLSSTSSGLWPSGFALPASTAPGTQFNLTWTIELPDGCNLTSVFYKMFSEQAESWMSPNAGTQWNNSITVNYSQGGGGGGGSGTVTSVGFTAPASNAFAVANPTTNALISFQNVGATPTNVFLRGDGSWQATGGSTLLYADFLASARYNNTQPAVAATANFAVPPATNVPGMVHNYLRYTSAGASTAFYRFVPTTDSALTSLSYESFWSTFSGGVLSGLIVQKGQV